MQTTVGRFPAAERERRDRRRRARPAGAARARPRPAGDGEVVAREFRGHDVFYRVLLDGVRARLAAAVERGRAARRPRLGAPHDASGVTVFFPALCKVCLTPNCKATFTGGTDEEARWRWWRRSRSPDAAATRVAAATRSSSTRVARRSSSSRSSSVRGGVGRRRGGALRRQRRARRHDRGGGRQRPADVFFAQDPGSLGAVADAPCARCRTSARPRRRALPRAGGTLGGHVRPHARARLQHGRRSPRTTCPTPSSS